MAQIECSNCGKTVDVPDCCGKPMAEKESKLVCSSCGKSQEIANCCGKPMSIKK